MDNTRLDSKGVKEKRFIPQHEDVCGNRRQVVASFCAFFDFVLFVPFDENYNLGYSLMRRIPEVVIDVMPFGIRAGSGCRVWNASGRPYLRDSLLRQHLLLERLWRRFPIGTEQLPSLLCQHSCWRSVKDGAGYAKRIAPAQRDR